MKSPKFSYIELFSNYEQSWYIVVFLIASHTSISIFYIVQKVYWVKLQQKFALTFVFSFVFWPDLIKNTLKIDHPF